MYVSQGCCGLGSTMPRDRTSRSEAEWKAWITPDYRRLEAAGIPIGSKMGYRPEWPSFIEVYAEVRGIRYIFAEYSNESSNAQFMGKHYTFAADRALAAARTIPRRGALRGYGQEHGEEFGPMVHDAWALPMNGYGYSPDAVALPMRGYGQEAGEGTGEEILAEEPLAEEILVEEPLAEAILPGAIIVEGKGILVYFQSSVTLDKGTAEMFADQIEALAGTHDVGDIERLEVVGKEGIYYVEALIWLVDLDQDVAVGGIKQISDPPGFIRLANEEDRKVPISKAMVYGGIAAGVVGLGIVGTVIYVAARKR